MLEPSTWKSRISLVSPSEGKAGRKMSPYSLPLSSNTTIPPDMVITNPAQTGQQPRFARLKARLWVYGLSTSAH